MTQSDVLSELFPNWSRRDDETIAAALIHPRVLWLRHQQGLHLVLLNVRPFSHPAELVPMVRQHVRAAVLARMCMSAPQLQPTATRLEQVHVLGFNTFSDDVLSHAWQQLAFRQAPTLPHWLLSHVRHELQCIDPPINDDPQYLQTAMLEPNAHQSTLMRIESELRAAMTTRESYWGKAPGELHRLLMQYAAVHGFDLQASEEGLQEAERLCRSLRAEEAQPHRMNWIPPLVFQALCDMSGVVASVAWGAKVAWGAYEPDAQGLIPPPLLCVHNDDGSEHYVAVAEALLDWGFYPESSEPLAEYLKPMFLAASSEAT